jgi:hypothetical protein
LWLKEPDPPIVITERRWQVLSLFLSLSSITSRNFDILNLGTKEVGLGALGMASVALAGRVSPFRV